MRLHHRSKWLALLCGAFFSSTALLADQIDGKALLDLLVKKGVLTPQEAAEVQTELTTPPAQPPGTAAVGVSAPAPSAAAPAPAATPPMAMQQGNGSPTSFKIGIADFTPVGFMDFTTVYRSTNVGSGIGTNFAAIPFANATAGQLSEVKFSAQNSRIGLRMDSTVGDAKVLGYVETDFLGNAASSLGVSSNAATLRMRLYFADIKWQDWEFLAGQDWSMLTPNRRSIGVMPSDIFYTQDMDTNYQVGLTWTRQPQVRAIYHASNELTMGVSVENPDQYAGGGNGSPAVVFPTGFSTAQVDTTAATTLPNVMPDIIGKVAYDTKIFDLAQHIEVAGLYSSFKVNNFATGATPINADSTETGTGASVNVNLELQKGFNLIGNTFWSKGGGRYIFGQAPDFVILPANASGAYTISALSASSYLGGAEWQAAPNSLLFGYYSHVNIGSTYGQQANGSYVGYGYPGSANTNNKSIEEYTLGEIQTIWKSPTKGALQVISQLSYADREPWYVAAGAPSKAHVGMFFLDLRYVLP